MAEEAVAVAVEAEGVEPAQAVAPSPPAGQVVAVPVEAVPGAVVQAQAVQAQAAAVEQEQREPAAAAWAQSPR